MDDVCDADPYTLRAAKHHGEPAPSPCPICSKPELPTSTTCSATSSASTPAGSSPAREIEQMAHEHGEIRIYVLEVCRAAPGTTWSSPTSSETAYRASRRAASAPSRTTTDPRRRAYREQPSDQPPASGPDRRAPDRRPQGDLDGDGDRRKAGRPGRRARAAARRARSSCATCHGWAEVQPRREEDLQVGRDRRLQSCWSSASIAIYITYRTIDIPDPNTDFQAQTTTVYYADGKHVLGTFALQNRQSIPLSEMPQSMPGRRRSRPRTGRSRPTPASTPRASSAPPGTTCTPTPARRARRRSPSST